MTVLVRHCRFAGYCLFLLLAFVGCTSSTSVTMQQSVTVSEPLEPQGVMWLGSRSAAVLNSEHYQPVSAVLEAAFSEAGFSTTDQKDEADHQAYLWFGKRRERREQFSNVTDGMNITTEYTWAMTLEVFSKEAVGTSQQYGGTVEAAVWCPSINSVLSELAQQLVNDFPAPQPYEKTTIVEVSPSEG